MKILFVAFNVGCLLLFAMAIGTVFLLSRYGMRDDVTNLHAEIDDIQNQLKTAENGRSGDTPEQLLALEEGVRKAGAHLQEVELARRRRDLWSVYFSLAGTAGSLLMLSSMLLIRRRKAAEGHLLLVSHTDREARTRIISARRATGR